ncbi:MAG: histidinol dehydrogenase [Deltaproteobacteria bacterium]|nr:histidinol dehydrogenase [Deltaproteobacteria bacterium]MBW1737642.1 histidinol dehydrogenase [Deltaproteobacteria bacterium]MBW1910719.1 histidinol dehydrogenase [Deltaproteobacteria bacterium]MBW2034822.1 histidinol dehydrogenase [Deltaproteobacteria bacterium]MBW2115129.1 histidinol dehydrogenase [Deltaproteobacteria bacterium]
MNLKPEKIDDLGPEKRKAVMERSMEDISSIYEDVRKIVEDVKKRGDAVSLEHYRKHKDSITQSDLEVTKEETDEAYKQVNPKVVDALKTAARNITRFHKAQIEREMWSIEVREGILAGRITRPMDIVGCYIPGGTAAYPSSILMTVLPAKVAGVGQIVAVTPPSKGMVANPATLVSADIAGCDRIFKVGGPWGVAGLAFGTETMPRVDKIVGPGNKYVTAAKMLVYGQVDIDSPAGPSEALILSDETGDPELIAVDFLSQVEHDPDSAAVLVTISEKIAEDVCDIINREFDTLPRKEIFESSLSKHSYVLTARDMEQAIEFTNEYAAEHLQIMTQDPFITLNKIRHAGSIFLGPYAPVPVGDYASGTNHVLPTGQCARMFSGLSVDDFIKKPTFQYLSRKGLEDLKDVVVTLAEEEGLPIHARAIKARFK